MSNKDRMLDLLIDKYRTRIRTLDRSMQICKKFDRLLFSQERLTLLKVIADLESVKDRK